MRKLPRKVNVLEGENAAFCAEVEKEEMDIHWYKDGVELRETHQTIIKSFGRTHILVFVNTMPQDAGLVSFLVGRSKTSSQLRVKGRVPANCRISEVKFGLFYLNRCFWNFHLLVTESLKGLQWLMGFSCFSGQTLSSQLSSGCADQHRAG